MCHPVRLDVIPAGQTSFPRVRRYSRGSDVIPEGQTSFPRKRESCDGGVFQDPDTSDRRLRGDDEIPGMMKYLGGRVLRNDEAS